jgi:hypothetical protein
LNEFKYYNCNPDLGKTINYYIPEKSLQWGFFFCFHLNHFVL